MMNFCFLFIAVGMVCFAHWIRIRRWELFIGIYEKPSRRILLQAISFGYLFNYFLPYKLGEVVRAWIAGRKMKNGKALGFSSVIVDRYLDIIAVGSIFVGLNLAGRDKIVSDETVAWYAISAIAFLLIAIVIYLFKGKVKYIISKVAALFNREIESGILQFSWALIWNFKDMLQKISKGKLLVYTVGMWISYLASYFFFALFLQSQGITATWKDVFTMLFTQNGVKGSTGQTTIYNNAIIIRQPVL